MSASRMPKHTLLKLFMGRELLRPVCQTHRVLWRSRKPLFHIEAPWFEYSTIREYIRDWCCSSKSQRPDQAIGTFVANESADRHLRNLAFHSKTITHLWLLLKHRHSGLLRDANRTATRTRADRRIPVLPSSVPPSTHSFDDRDERRCWTGRLPDASHGLTWITDRSIAKHAE